MNTLRKNKSVLIFGTAMALLFWLLKWLEWRFIIKDYSLELYIGILAFLFTALGIWLSQKLNPAKVKVVEIEKEILAPVCFEVDKQEQEKLGLSDRELEVLSLVAKGFSNQEIADRLFISLNTIKTHSSKIYEKLEVKRRTHAVDKAKKLHLIP